MDAPSYVFDSMITDMIDNVDNLSGKTSDYMKLVNDFARTGLNAEQSMDSANTATLLQNISDMTADESINAITAAMTAYKGELKSTSEVADKLNEIDNKNAISSQDLALSMTKAASTAKTFGVSLDELLGLTYQPLIAVTL